MTTTGIQAAGASADEFAGRLLGAILGAQETQAVYLGDRLGWYRALAGAGPLTSVELADRTGTAERYAREWLEHQAVCGYLTVDDAGAHPTERRYRLPGGHAEVLTDEDSLAFVAPIARFVAGVGRHLDLLVDAYRSGGGVSWERLGDDAREAQAAANRPLFLHQLGQEILPSLPDVHARLAGGGRVADVGCGGGWSSIGIALSYPEVTVDGFDIDAPSVEMARRHAAEAGVADRVRFHVADGAGLFTDTGYAYDAVFAFECVHELANPIGFLTAMRRLAGSDGIVIVMDERTEERFTAPAGEVERLLYGYSLMCCLPDGLSHQPSAGTGTVMRPDTLAAYATAAGFSAAEVLAVEHDFFRFYRLHI
jgi:2-polyprenyl-3-methyl-5-hydroxy-6-metoxy-1,4-benzoquinol methylase